MPNSSVAGLCFAAVLSACTALPQESPAGKTTSPAESVHDSGQTRAESRRESSADNGWARYGRLTLDLGGTLHYVYEQGRGEFSATAIERDSGSVRFRAVSIPRAGVFYFPSEAAPCESGPVERLGLYSKLVLYYLGRAFPSGPDRIEGPSSAVVDGAIPELHFLEGTMKGRGDIHAEVRVSSDARRVAEYVVHGDKDDLRGTWEAGQDRAVVGDDEQLDGWNACWYGVRTMAGDQIVFQPDLPFTQLLRSFGDVRKALGDAAPAAPPHHAAPDRPHAPGQ